VGLETNGTARHTIRHRMTAKSPSPWSTCAPRSAGNTQAPGNHGRMRTAGDGSARRRRAPTTPLLCLHEPRGDSQRTSFRQLHSQTAHTSIKLSGISGTKLGAEEYGRAALLTRGVEDNGRLRFRREAARGTAWQRDDRDQRCRGHSRVRQRRDSRSAGEQLAWRGLHRGAGSPARARHHGAMMRAVAPAASG